jgi:5'-nucleotidase/UDP-sugar diphosphatase
VKGFIPLSKCICNGLSLCVSFYSLYTLADILGPAITRLSIQATLAFNNKLTFVQLNAGQLLAALENAVSAFPVHDGRFPQVAGLRLAVNTTMPPVEGMAYMQTASRLETAVLEGRNGEADTHLVDRFELMVDVDRTFVLATNSFLASGGDFFSSIGEGIILAETGIGEQQILEDYVRVVAGGDVAIPDPPPRPSRLFIFE